MINKKIIKQRLIKSIQIKKHFFLNKKVKRYHHKMKCHLSNRHRGFYKLFHLSRFHLHDLGSNGFLPGIIKK